MIENYAIADQSKLSLMIRGRRIAAEDFANWQSATAILATANRLLDEARLDTERIKEDARKSGYQEGVDQAFKEMLQPILEAKAQARNLVASNLSQVVLIAETMLRRILPRLSQDKIVEELLVGLLAEIRDEQQLTFRVHPESLAQTRQAVSEWLASQVYRSEPTIVADATMSRFSCVVRSELGEIRVGVEQQIQILKETALRSASQMESNRDIGT